MVTAVYTVARPYTLTFAASGHAYPVSAEEAQRLLDSYPVTTFSRQRVVLLGCDGTRTTLTPATLGGGPAFVFDKPATRTVRTRKARR